MTANHGLRRLHHLKTYKNKPVMSMRALGQELVLLLAVLTLALAEDEDDASYVVYANGATSERNLPLCAGPREACNVVRQRFWLSPAVYRMCKCRDRTCPAEFTYLPDKRTIAFNARAQLKFCSRVGEIEPCKDDAEAAGIGLNGTIHIYCFCGPNHFYKRLHRNSTGQYFKCKQFGSCRQGDFCGHIAASSYETYHVCTCPRKHICVLKDRNKVYTDEFQYRGPAYRGFCVPR